jgi:hypothetical protein
VIAKGTFDRAWLEEASKGTRIPDIILLEKAARALYLLEGLVGAGLDLTFKGGTALMLKLQDPRRLSIDIDIITMNEADLEIILEKAREEKGFTRFERDERSNQTQIKKAHYKFYYKPAYQTLKTEAYILLDVVFEETSYTTPTTIPINVPFLQQEGEPLMVRVPSFDDILGDKLTAFAPNTTGIPYGKGKEMEMAKQLFDIGTLFDHVGDIDVVSQTFNGTARVQMGYRSFEGMPDIVLDDIIDTALLICTYGKDGKGNYNEISEGASKVSSFIISEKYNIQKAILDAAKAAYIAALIKSDKDTIERFSDTNQTKDWEIQLPFYIRLNKLKKSNPEAFFYWYKIFQLLQ